MIRRKIARLLCERGPLSGGELYDALRIDRFELWRECQKSFLSRGMGRRYMRLDERLPGYARLSPSILREFLTYSAVGLENQEAALSSRLGGMASRIAEISSRKTALARLLAERVISGAALAGLGSAPTAFVLAGDIAYGMAHEEPRPERSTGRLVRGSDIDLVVLVDDSASDEYFAALDGTIHREKFLLLANPDVNEEIDYVVKKLSRVREQVAFDTFKRMVACKILDEGLYLYGDQAIFRGMKAILSESGVVARLRALLAKAEAERSEAVERLSAARSLDPGDPLSRLFFSAEESEEFE
jgi:hypothetical protein